jgi:hypothetical protein
LLELVIITYIYWRTKCNPKTLIWMIIQTSKKLLTCIGQLSALQNLNLQDCSRLQELPIGFELFEYQNLVTTSLYSIFFT